MESRGMLSSSVENLTDDDSGNDDASVRREGEHQMPLNQRVIRTFTMACLYIGLGFNMGVIGPTLFDLARLYTDGNVEVLGTAFSVKAVGIVLGCFFGAFVADRFRKKADLFLFLITFTNGISCAATPWMPSLALVGVLFFIQGVNHGAYNVACCSLNIAIWGDKASGPVHALLMCFSFGIALSQPISGYFASEVPFYAQTTATIITFAPTTTKNNSSNDSDTSINRIQSLYDTPCNNESHLIEVGTVGENSTASGSRIYIPYGIFGSYQIALSFLFVAFFFLGATYTSTTVTIRKSFREMLNPSSCSGGRGCYGVYVLSSLFFMYICISTREAAMETYVCASGMYLFKMSAFKASLLGMTHQSILLLGRFLAIFVTLFVRVQIMVFAEIVIGLVLFLLTSVFGLRDELPFWILMSVLPVFIGPVYPALMAWADRYIESTGFVVAIIDAGAGTGIFLANYLGGVAIHRLDARWVYYMCTVSSGFLLLIFLPLQVVVSRLGNGDRHTNGQRKTISQRSVT